MIPEGFERAMGWVVALLLLIMVGIVFDFLRTWWTARQLREHLELKTEEDRSWFDDHFSLRREK